MEGGEVFVMIGSIVLAFFMGFAGALLFGGKTAFNYLKVKMSRGSRVLLFVRTEFGWRSYTAKKEQNTLLWKYDGKKIATVVQEDSVYRYLRLDCAYVDSKSPTTAIVLKDGAFYPKDFDAEVFNNILIRALTRPTAEGDDLIKKLIIGILILLVLVGFGVLMLTLKVNELSGGAVQGAVI